MVPTGGRMGPVLSPLLQAALDCFSRQGYHGTSIREIASHAGLSVTGVYHHYVSKHALCLEACTMSPSMPMLVAVMVHAMEDLSWRRQAAAEAAGEEPEIQLAAQVECLVLYHARRQDVAFIASSEIRSPTGDHLATHVGRRDRQQRVVDAILQGGAHAGVFATPWPLETSRAIVTLCIGVAQWYRSIGVAQWYRSGGPLLPETIAERYVTIARGMVQATPAAN